MGNLRIAPKYSMLPWRCFVVAKICWTMSKEGQISFAMDTSRNTTTVDSRFCEIALKRKVERQKARKNEDEVISPLPSV